MGSILTVCTSTASRAPRATWCSAPCSTPAAARRVRARSAAWRSSRTCIWSRARGARRRVGDEVLRARGHETARGGTHEHRTITTTIITSGRADVMHRGTIARSHTRTSQAPPARITISTDSLTEIAALIDRSALSAARQGPGEGPLPPARRGRSGDPRHAASSRCTCTRSARSTRSSTSSAPSTRSSSSAPTASSSSPLNVGGGTVQSRARRVSGAGAGDRCGCWRARRSTAGPQKRAGHADRRAARHRLRAGVRPAPADARRARSATAPATATFRTRRTCCAC